MSTPLTFDGASNWNASRGGNGSRIGWKAHCAMFIGFERTFVLGSSVKDREGPDGIRQILPGLMPYFPGRIWELFVETPRWGVSLDFYNGETA